MGISTPIPYDYTISLGSNSVKLFEMTRAYGVFANGGFRVEPYAIERVESSRGTVLYEAKKARTSKVLNINTAATMTAILKTVIQNGTGMAANIGKPAAGKTGTTDDCKDAYFIGFTPDVVTGVWVGNDDNTRMGELTGGSVPARIWKDVMVVATEPYGNSDFEYPEVILNPFKASSVSIITQSEARKAWEEQDEKEKQGEVVEDETVVLDNNIATPPAAPIVKPDSIKPIELLQQIKKKDTAKATDNAQEKTESKHKTEQKAEPAPEPKPEQFAPIPMTTMPMNVNKDKNDD
jgi:penicillin-binding protein 1A